MLSRRSEYRPEKGGVENQPTMSVLSKNHFEERLKRSFICSSARLSSLPARKWNKEFLTLMEKEGKQDHEYQEEMKKQEVASEEPAPTDQKAKKGKIEVREGLFYRTHLAKFLVAKNERTQY